MFGVPWSARVNDGTCQFNGQARFMPVGTRFSFPLDGCNTKVQVTLIV